MSSIILVTSRAPKETALTRRLVISFSPFALLLSRLWWLLVVVVVAFSSLALKVNDNGRPDCSQWSSNCLGGWLSEVAAFHDNNINATKLNLRRLNDILVQGI